MEPNLLTIHWKCCTACLRPHLGFDQSCIHTDEPTIHADFPHLHPYFTGISTNRATVDSRNLTKDN